MADLSHDGFFKVRVDQTMEIFKKMLPVGMNVTDAVTISNLKAVACLGIEKPCTLEKMNLTAYMREEGNIYSYILNCRGVSLVMVDVEAKKCSLTRVTSHSCFMISPLICDLLQFIHGLLKHILKDPSTFMMDPFTPSSEVKKESSLSYTWMESVQNFAKIINMSDKTTIRGDTDDNSTFLRQSIVDFCFVVEGSNSKVLTEFSVSVHSPTSPHLSKVYDASFWLYHQESIILLAHVKVDKEKGKISLLATVEMDKNCACILNDTLSRL